MKILLTGSSGYIGSALIPELKQLGHTIVGLDRRLPAYGVEADSFHHVDILDEGGLDRVFDGIDVVMHLAAAKDDWGLTDEEYFRDNLEATERLVQTGRAQGVKSWLFYSTVGVYGPSTEAIDESAPFNAPIAYGQSKAAAEKIFQGYSAVESDAEIVIIRPSAVYGPKNPSNTNIYRLIEALDGGRFVMVGDGTALKTTSHIGNLVPATLFLLDRLEPGMQAFNYVDDPVMSTGDLVDSLCQSIGKPSPRWRIPLTVAKPIAKVSDVLANVTGIDFPITAARIEKFCTSTVFDASAIRRLGFVAPVSNEDALAATVQWHLTTQRVA